MTSFEKLGTQVAARWKEQGGRIESFAEIATQSLRESGVLSTVSIGEIAEWLASSRDIPKQEAKEFGQPPINVYVGENFHIQVLFWLDGTTAIHEHSFAGAFGVLHGSSVHSRYRFELQRELAKELLIGNVRFVSSELLQKGDLHPIEVGSSFIHALFHLDHPSVSVVVRTSFPASTIQYSYIKPHVAFDPSDEDKTLSTQMRLLESLRSFRSDSYWRYADLLLDHERPLLLFNVLGNASQSSASAPDQWQALVDKACRLHGTELVEKLLASINTENAGRKLSRLRMVVHAPDYRFFLALLLNVPDRNSLLSLIARRFPSEQPEVLAMRWIHEMSRAGLFLTRLEPEMLTTIELILKHKSFDEARAAVARANDASPAQADENNMRKLWHDAHRILFSTSPDTVAARSEAALSYESVKC